jgi:ribosomal protein S18 acetylase RimI-like enzyme
MICDFEVKAKFAKVPVEISTLPKIYHLRPAGIEDSEICLQLFGERHISRFAALEWNEEQLTVLLQMQYRARCTGYKARFPGLESFMICDGDHQPVGELLVCGNEDRVRVVDISLFRVCQGRGIGTRLLLDLQDQAGAKGQMLELSVDHENPARRLYERLGFEVIGSDALQAEMIWTADGRGKRK